VAERGFQSFLKAVTDAVNVANAAYQRGGGLAGISTGLSTWTRSWAGCTDSDLIILAGRPSMGKTSLATNIAFNIAKAYKPRPQARRHRRRGRGRRRRLLQPRDVAPSSWRRGSCPRPPKCPANRSAAAT
jgi:hypothetical protein